MALEAWEEAQALLLTKRPLSWSRRDVVTALDSLSRRSRQVERILEASMVSFVFNNYFFLFSVPLYYARALIMALDT